MPDRSATGRTPRVNLYRQAKHRYLANTSLSDYTTFGWKENVNSVEDKLYWLECEASNILFEPDAGLTSLQQDLGLEGKTCIDDVACTASPSLFKASMTHNVAQALLRQP